MLCIFITIKKKTLFALNLHLSSTSRSYKSTLNVIKFNITTKWKFIYIYYSQVYLSQYLSTENVC